ncbi:MAG: hypothetical protein QM626_03740 [Microbacterium sp.]|uniref:hypothetical protein n=1 Tax=Microbacterium sp. TaxID=51671 RepID=UPI0039E46F5A
MSGRHPWSRFRHSRFLPATVITGILAVAAGLFAGSYTYASADPQPQYVPVALVGDVDTDTETFLDDIDDALEGALQIRSFSSASDAREALDDQDVFAVFDVTSDQGITVWISTASGTSVASALESAIAAVVESDQLTVTVTDLHPLQDTDPHGLTLFYMTIAAVVVGFVGAVQLGVNARALCPWERIGFTAAYAILAGFAIVAAVDLVLGALDLPVWESWGILALTMFTCGMVYTLFNDLFGRWAMIPTWALMILLGNPSSGGAVAWPLLPTWLAIIGGWLPPGASINAQHTAVYFPDHQHAWPFLVLIGWAVLATVLYLVRVRLRRGGPASTPPGQDGAA